jgi:hypothetical protein
MNVGSNRVSSAQVVAAYNGEQQAIRVMPAALRKKDIDGDVPDITVTREAALKVLRRLKQDPSTQMEAFTWGQMARTGPDYLGMPEVDVNLEPGHEDEIIEVLRALDYLDDRPMQDSRLDTLIQMLEGSPSPKQITHEL